MSSSTKLIFYTFTLSPENLRASQWSGHRLRTPRHQSVETIKPNAGVQEEYMWNSKNRVRRNFEMSKAGSKMNFGRDSRFLSGTNIYKYGNQIIS